MSLNDSWIIAGNNYNNLGIANDLSVLSAVVDQDMSKESQALFYTDTEAILTDEEGSSEDLANDYGPVELQQARMDAFNRYSEAIDETTKQDWALVINKIMDALRLQTAEKVAQVKLAKIVKQDDGYYVKSEEGKNLGGPYTKEDAEERLHQVEYFKNN